MQQMQNELLQLSFLNFALRQLKLTSDFPLDTQLATLDGSKLKASLWNNREKTIKINSNRQFYSILFNEHVEYYTFSTVVIIDIKNRLKLSQKHTTNYNA